MNTNSLISRLKKTRVNYLLMRIYFLSVILIEYKRKKKDIGKNRPKEKEEEMVKNYPFHG